MTGMYISKGGFGEAKDPKEMDQKYLMSALNKTRQQRAFGDTEVLRNNEQVLVAECIRREELAK